MSETLSTDVAIDSVYMLVCCFLLFLVVLGISLVYSGLTQRKSSFTMLTMPIILSTLVLIDWFIWGYSLCYGTSKNKFIGSLKYAVLRELGDGNGMYSTSRGEILAELHFLFNGLMKVVTVVITFPACIAERGRLLPMLAFLFLWSAIVYSPVTYWIWNKNGWLSTQQNYVPVLDFAGGTCIHVLGGFTGLVYSYYLGPRNPKILMNYRSSSNLNMVIGTAFLTYGWCGFIAGCDFKFSRTSFMIIINSLLCASCSGIAWCLIDYYISATPLEGDSEAEITPDSSSNERAINKEELPRRRFFSIISYSSGIISGLVVFTPCGGYVSTSSSFWKSIVCGLVGGMTGNLATRVKYWLNVDDALDIFAVHGICGIMGSLLVGFFADDLYGSKGGWVEHHWKQLGYQVVGIVVVAVYASVVSLILLFIVDFIPGLHLRIDKDFNRRIRREQEGNLNEEEANMDQVRTEYEMAEIMGTDWYEFNGEYSMDFMEFIKDLNPGDYAEEIETKEYESSDIELTRDKSSEGMRNRNI